MVMLLVNVVVRRQENNWAPELQKRALNVDRITQMLEGEPFCWLWFEGGPMEIPRETFLAVLRAIDARRRGDDDFL